MPTDIRNPDMVTSFTRFMNRHNKDDLDPVKNKFSACDIDGVFVGQYTKTTTVPVFFLEVKTFTGGFSDTQKTTLTILDKVFKLCDGQSIEIPIFRAGIQPRILVYLGLHVLYCSGKDPDDSSFMTWDNHPITRDELIKILRFETPPEKVEPYFGI